MKTLTDLFILAVTLVAANSAFGQGTLIFQHLGANDPVIEGASLIGSGTVGAVIGDNGVDAWSIHATTTFYRTPLSPEQQAMIAASDWTISLNLRLVANTSFVSLRTGIEEFALNLSSQADGDPVVRTSLGLSYALEGGGSGYHNYALKYHESSATANLWIDGVERLSGIAAYGPTAATTFDWGIVQSPVLASANWNLVSLTVVPEPSSVALCFSGGLLLMAYKFHRRPTQ